MGQPASALPWKIDEPQPFMPMGIIKDDEDGEGIVESTTGTEDERQDFDYIVEACNNYPKAVDLLREAILQIEYLHNKFQETGSGNSVLSKLKTFVDGVDK